MSGRDASALIRAGVYRWSRNPQNVGWSLVLLGVAVLGRSLLAALLVVLQAAAVHWHLVWVEEPHLARQFGDAYRAYAASVPRYLGSPGRRAGRPGPGRTGG